MHRDLRRAAVLCTFGVLIASSRVSEGQTTAPDAEEPSDWTEDTEGPERLPGLERYFERTDLRHGLTAEQVAARAVARSSLVELRQATARAVKAEEDEAVARLWPELTLSARYTRLSPIQMPSITGGGEGSLVGTQAPAGPLSPDDELFALPPVAFPIYLNQYELKATLNVPVSDYLYRTRTAIRAAEHSSDSARWDEEAAKLKVAADARLAYYDWVRAVGQEVVAEESLANFKAREQDAQVLFDTGLLSQADLMGARAQTKNAEVLAVRARHLTRVTEERIRTITYEPDSKRAYKLGENLLAPAPPVPGIMDAEALLEEAVRNRAELKTLHESEEAIKGLVSLAKSEGHPRLDVTGNYIYANPNPLVFPQQNRFEPLWNVNVVLTWRPTDIVRSTAMAHRQEARAGELRAQRRALIESLRIEVTEAMQSVFEADATLGSAEEALSAARESYRGRRELFRIGRGTLVDVNDAEVALTRARLSFVDAHIEARTSRVRLNYAVGRDRVPQGSTP